MIEREFNHGPLFFRVSPTDKEISSIRYVRGSSATASEVPRYLVPTRAALIWDDGSMDSWFSRRGLCVCRVNIIVKNGHRGLEGWKNGKWLHEALGGSMQR